MSTSTAVRGPDERTRLLQDANGASSTSHAIPDHAAHDGSAEEAGNMQEKHKFTPGSLKFWMLVLSYSSLLFLFSSNATGITTMYFAIAETLQAYQDAATWMTASYMVGLIAHHQVYHEAENQCIRLQAPARRRLLEDYPRYSSQQMSSWQQP